MISKGPSLPGLLDLLCNQCLSGQWFSLGTAVSSTIKIDCHDIIKILLKLVLNLHNPNQNPTEL